ncbi:MAG: YigZ family protein [Clostridia bacterium]|nr:YigZ family protein [Clostridia bacterium]
MSGVKTVVGETETTTVIERSKFVCSVKGVNSEEEAKGFINSVRKKHSLANHNCYAYIADDKGLTQKFSDDGEPQGTAGMPMLGVLKARGLYKVVVVVTRYFGGIKLGAGGLVRAYSGAVAKTLDAAETKEFFQTDFIAAELTYSQHKKMPRIADCEVVSVDYGQVVTVKMAVKK